MSGDVSKNGRRLRHLLAIVFIALWCLPNIRGEQLPLRSYSASDGLASSVIHHVSVDSQGFLWLGARGGLSRFDGTVFTNYIVGDEASPLVHSIIESRDGSFWIATDKAIYRTARRAESAVRPVSDPDTPGSRRLDVERVVDRGGFNLFEASDGRIWMASEQGVFVISTAAGMPEQVDAVSLDADETRARRTPAGSFAEGPDSSIWIAAYFGFVRVLPDGHMVRYTVPNNPEYSRVFSIRIDLTGRIWLSHSSGVFVLTPGDAGDTKGGKEIRTLQIEDRRVGLVGAISFPMTPDSIIRLDFVDEGESGDDAGPIVEDIFVSRDGRVWVPTSTSLYLFEKDSYLRLRDTNSLPGRASQIVEDGSGNIWFGTYAGVVKYVRNGAITYTKSSGLDEPSIHSIQETSNGEVVVVHGEWLVSTISPEGVKTVKLKLPEDDRPTWTSNPVFFDPSGTVWALSARGLYQFPKYEGLSNLGSSSPKRITDNVQTDYWYRSFADSRGNAWLSTRGTPEKTHLYRYDGSWTQFPDNRGLPVGKAVAAFAESANGDIWVGFYGESGLARYRDGRFKLFTEADGIPPGATLAMRFDRNGRLWAASTESGLSRIDTPSDDRLAVVRFNEANGLSSNNVRCLTEDLSGNIYAGTVRGVSRIDAGSGLITHITTDDGLAADFVQAAFRDRQGQLWFGTANGLSRLTPAPGSAKSPPEVIISDLEIGGTRYSISPFGQREATGIEVASTENNLQISYAAVGEKGSVRFQYLLEGSGQNDWGTPSEQRSINFGNLSFGSYRLLIRSTNLAGEASSEPAILSFTIKPPFFRTWWFAGLVILVLGTAVFGLDRYRVSKTRQVQSAYDGLQKSEAERRLAEVALERSQSERIAELQRIRSRIATDLHDDIGSSLTQIAVYSELARQKQIESGNAAEQLDMITDVSNDLVETMSDIVWAINPKKDQLADLTQRMRRFAANALSARDIEMSFTAPPADLQLAMGANVRREVFLIFKETVNNIVKHSHAKTADIDFQIREEGLQIAFVDDGVGFEQNVSEDETDWKRFRGGNGLMNMRKRASDLGGTYEIESRPGHGTTVWLRVPLETAT